jgi:uncharacterized protein (TIGR01777 family)
VRIVLWLLIAQCALGAFDSLWHHELTERLPSRRSARRELLLHSMREFLYGVIFLGLAWREWRGAWAAVLAALLLIEILLTLADFLEEDRTRALPGLERVLHTVLAINYGAWLGVFAPLWLSWLRLPSALAPVSYGMLSTLLTLFAAGVTVLAVRNLAAALNHLRPPHWVREPIFVGQRSAPRTYLVTGATGFIGAALVRTLLARGDAVTVLSRSREKALDRFGPHVRCVESLDELEAATRIDGLVNLAGAGLMTLPWVGARRRVLRSSRGDTTRAVVGLLRRLETPPAVLVSGSAIGYYGARGDEVCDEDAAPQREFQSELCREWEAEAARAQPLGVRVVLLRTGLVLGARGGALPLMALPVRLGAGATLGGGAQWMSWIHLGDMVRLIVFALDTCGVSGALNATAPEPVRHREFQRTLAARLGRPLGLRLPARVPRAVLGEMSQIFTHGQRVVPRKALAHGFLFRYATLDAALAALYPAQRLRVAGSTSQVYFNGDCSVCNAEMTHYAGIARSQALPIRFIDSTHEPQAFMRYGLRAEHLEGRLYHRDPKGRLTSGLDALMEVWTELPRYRWVARTLALPVLHGAASAAYDLAVAPTLAWNARRRRALGRTNKKSPASPPGC